MQSQLESQLKYKFKNGDLIKEALVHKSYAVEHGFSFCNERLEFLGDSVLGLSCAYYLFLKYPQRNEGELSKIKARMVSRKSLCSFARKISLGKYVKVAGINFASKTGQDTILADAFEAVLGAMYLDGGFEVAFNFLKDFLEQVEISNEDYKSMLQEIVQKETSSLPMYSVIKTEGPEHEKIFTVNVSLNGKVIAIGRGKSKKEAQQSAAMNALKTIKQKN